MRASAIVLSALLLLTSCGSDPAEPDAAAVVGLWAWVESSGGIQGHTLSPDTEGYEVTLALGEDGSAAARRDGEMLSGATYTIRKIASPGAPNAPVEYEITFDPALQLFDFADAETFVLRKTSSLSIELQSPCCDMYDHSFTRLPLEY